MKKKSSFSSVDRTTVFAGAALAVCSAVLLIPKVRRALVATGKTYYKRFSKDESIGIEDSGTFHNGNGVGEVEGGSGTRWQPSL